MTELLQAHNLHWSAGGNHIVNDVSLSVSTGETLGIVGPNGSGKTSLLRLLAGLTKPDRGTVFIDGADAASMNRKQMALRMAYVEQLGHTELELKVRDVIALGRVPHQKSWMSPGSTGTEVIDRAAESTGVTHLLNRAWSKLSGGERQRTHIARALAQETPMILLDEPTNHLDISHQLEILRLTRNSEATAVTVLHDLNLAAMFCDRIIVMSGGQVVAEGTPSAVLTEELLHDVFLVHTRITHDDGLPHIRFLI